MLNLIDTYVNPIGCLATYSWLGLHKLSKINLFPKLVGVKNAFLRTFGDKEGSKGGIHGFSKKLNDRANEGYNHFDSFHKKDADKFGYEVHSEFGKSDKVKVDVPKQNGENEDEEGNIFS